MTSAKLLGLTLLGSASLITASAIAEPVADGGKKFSTALTGEAEVTGAGVPNAGDLDGNGSARITVNPGQGRVCWEITTDNNIDAVTMAHIHSAPAGLNGPIVIHLSAVQNGTTNSCSSVIGPGSGGGPIPRSLLDAIRKSPQGYYVNVHTTAFPAGALRGQLG